jgi:hypothetical protein
MHLIHLSNVSNITELRSLNSPRGMKFLVLHLMTIKLAFCYHLERLGTFPIGQSISSIHCSGLLGALILDRRRQRTLRKPYR